MAEEQWVIIEQQKEEGIEFNKWRNEAYLSVIIMQFMEGVLIWNKWVRGRVAVDERNWGVEEECSKINLYNKDTSTFKIIWFSTLFGW